MSLVGRQRRLTNVREIWFVLLCFSLLVSQDVWKRRITGVTEIESCILNFRLEVKVLLGHQMDWTFRGFFFGEIITCIFVSFVFLSWALVDTVSHSRALSCHPWTLIKTTMCDYASSKDRKVAACGGAGPTSLHLSFSLSFSFCFSFSLRLSIATGTPHGRTSARRGPMGTGHHK